MRSARRLLAGASSALALAALFGATAVVAQEAPVSVTYGPLASTAEGDPDYREIIFLSVPESVRDRLFLRVFDPDSSGDHDQLYGAGEETTTQFQLYGGDGAFTGAAVAAPDEAQLAAGSEIAVRSFGADPGQDGRWQTLMSFAPERGEAVGGRRIFRLQVTGTAGDDANLYEVTLSLREHRNLPPDGLEIFSFAPSLRVPDEDLITEVRFLVPEDAERLTIRNFDAANAEIALTTAFRSAPLAASGQNEWREAEVALEDEERGRLAALTFGGGAEMPNDVTFEIRDQDGRELPIQLAARAWRPNARPLPEADVGLLANCFSVAFDASRSTDPDGEPLSYLWEFGDGKSASGRAVVHTYDGPGSYRTTLRVSDASGQVGAGARRDFEVFVKRPPTAVTGDDLVVAPGELVAFDGGRSLDGERPIARYLWEFGDGELGEGQNASHAFATPGRYIAISARRGRHGATMQFFDRSADRAGQRRPGRGRGRRPAGVGRRGDRAGRRPQLRRRWRGGRVFLGPRRRRHDRRPERPPCLRRARHLPCGSDRARQFRRRQRRRRGRFRGRGERSADRRGGLGPPGRDRRGDQLRCRCLDRSGRRSGAVSVGLW